MSYDYSYSDVPTCCQLHGLRKMSLHVGYVGMPEDDIRLELMQACTLKQLRNVINKTKQERLFLLEVVMSLHIMAAGKGSNRNHIFHTFIVTSYQPSNLLQIKPNHFDCVTNTRTSHCTTAFLQHNTINTTRLQLQYNALVLMYGKACIRYRRDMFLSQHVASWYWIVHYSKTVTQQWSTMLPSQPNKSSYTDALTAALNVWAICSISRQTGENVFFLHEGFYC